MFDSSRLLESLTQPLLSEESWRAVSSSLKHQLPPVVQPGAVNEETEHICLCRVTAVRVGIFLSYYSRV